MIYPGTQFGPYYVDRELGRGGMAVVYHAVDERTGAEVALKVLPQEVTHNRGLVRRFEQESELALRLRHPNIVRAYESNEIDGIPFIALHFAPNGTLATLLNRRPEPIPLEEALQILRRVALALDYAHSRNVLHRDVKPSNILIGPSGQIWLADFGLAKRMDAETTQFTASSRAIGTPAYMSPEQIEQDTEIDARSDIYSLGVVAYSMLTGAMPFEAASQLSLLKTIVNDPPIAPQSHNPKLEQGTCYVLERALAKDPALRYATASEFIDLLAESPTLQPSRADWEKLDSTPKPNNKKKLTAQAGDKQSQSASAQPRSSEAKQARPLFDPVWKDRLLQPMRQPLGWLVALASAVAVLLAFQLFSGRVASEAITAPRTTVPPPVVIVLTDATVTPVDDAQTGDSQAGDSQVSDLQITIADEASEANQTETFTATPSRTPRPSPTLIPKAIATNRPSAEMNGATLNNVERSPTSTPVPDLPNTKTPTPKPSPSATPTRIAARTTPLTEGDGKDTTAILEVSAQLLAPNEGETHYGKSSFRWLVDDTLPTGYAFEPIFWQPGQDPLRDGRGWGGSTTGTSLAIDLTKHLSPGMVMWGVRLVEVNPFKPVRLISAQRSIIVQVPGQPHNAPDNEKRAATATPRRNPDKSSGAK